MIRAWATYALALALVPLLYVITYLCSFPRYTCAGWVWAHRLAHIDAVIDVSDALEVEREHRDRRL